WGRAGRPEEGGRRRRRHRDGSRRQRGGVIQLDRDVARVCRRGRSSRGDVHDGRRQTTRTATHEITIEAVMSRYDFLVESYRTERLKTLSVWSQIPDDRMRFRPEPRARSPLEQMVHQCVSEDLWMGNMLGVAASLPALPPDESRQS